MIVAVAGFGLCRICRLGSLRPRLQAVEEQYQQYFDGESCAALSRAEYSFILLTRLPPSEERAHLVPNFDAPAEGNLFTFSVLVRVMN
jgi:hypothetical protein